MEPGHGTMELKEHIEGLLETTISNFNREIEEIVVAGRDRPLDSFEEELEEFLTADLKFQFHRISKTIRFENEKIKRRIALLNKQLSKDLVEIITLKRIAVGVLKILFSGEHEQYLVVALTLKWIQLKAKIEKLEKKIEKLNGRRVFTKIVEHYIHNNPKVKNYILANDLTTPDWLIAAQMDLFKKVIIKPNEHLSLPGTKIVYELAGKEHEYVYDTIENMICEARTFYSESQRGAWDALLEKL